MLPRLIGMARVGMARASEMILTGEMMPVADLADWGPLNRIVLHEQLIDAALEFAERIAGNPPLSLAMAKWGLQRAQETDFDVSFDWVNYAMQILRTSTEHKEAVREFVERRERRREERGGDAG